MVTAVTKCVYICSSGFSGSTLLDMLLGSNSRIESLGEASHLPKNIALNSDCSCGQKISDCEQWQAILPKLATKLHIDLRNNPYSLNLGFYRARKLIDKSQQTMFYLAKRKLVMGWAYVRLKFYSILGWLPSPYKNVIRNNFAMYDSVLEVTGKEIVVDSSKSYLHAISLYLEKPNDVKVIYLARDPRAVLFSYLKKGQTKEDWLSNWKNYYERSFPLMKKLVAPNAIVQITYEDLCENTEKVMESLSEFMGVEFERSMLSNENVVYHLTNGNRRTFSRREPVHVDRSWMNSLEKNQINYVRKYAGSLSKSLGYDV